VSPVAALIAAAGLAAAGFLVLFAGAGPVAALLGALNLAWYNLVYTPLKTKTRFALFAGALTGAIPVAIGWAGAGGALGSPALLAVALFMYLWQIPHFLLLALTYGEEYERAGFRCFLTRAPERRGRSAVLAWTILAVCSTALFPLLGAVAVIPLTAAVFTAGAGTAAVFTLSAKFPAKVGLPFASRSLYLYQLVVLVCLIAQGLAA
jgi:protoheme IX farnesyltransferase